MEKPGNATYEGLSTDRSLKNFRTIIGTYRFSEPLSRFLNTFYKANRHMGSRDRRQASRLSYAYFRLGKALQTASMEERLSIACFLCDKTEDELNKALITQYTSLDPSQVNIPLDEKLNILKKQYPLFSLYEVFPLHEQLSDGIDKEAFIKSFFTQPKLWIRVRKGYYATVVKELEEKKIAFETDENMRNCIGFENATSLDALEVAEKAYFEIQDRSSQRVGDFFKQEKNQRWWDCCAASGGKSLLLADIEPSIKLTLSDIRPTIIQNLEKRLRKARIQPENIICADITDKDKLKTLLLQEFDGIIADVSCTGSGTWTRTPEMLQEFGINSITGFQKLQLQVVKNIVLYLKKGQPLIYITCSAFKQENEAQLAALESTGQLKTEHFEVLKGYEYLADTMFVARLVKL